MNSKSLIILGVAVVCGVVAMVGASQFLTKKPKSVAMREVLVAARDLKVEEVLNAAAVKVVKQPVTSVPVGAFAAASEVEGRWVQIQTLKDEPILAAKLAPKDQPPGLISRIPKGKRAYAIEVTEQTGVSGFILPDHRVDVLQDTGDRSRNNKTSKARTILQNMLVLSVGQEFTRPEDKNMLARTVTLAVTPNEAEALTAARSRGALALSLRGLDDTEIVKTEVRDPEEEGDEDEAKPKPQPAPAPLPQPIVVAPPPPPVPRHRPVVIIHGVRRRDVYKVPIQPVEVERRLFASQPASPPPAATEPLTLGGSPASSPAG